MEFAGGRKNIIYTGQPEAELIVIHTVGQTAIIDPSRESSPLEFDFNLDHGLVGFFKFAKDSQLPFRKGEQHFLLDSIQLHGHLQHG